MTFLLSIDGLKDVNGAIARVRKSMAEIVRDSNPKTIAGMVVHV